MKESVKTCVVLSLSSCYVVFVCLNVGGNLLSHTLPGAVPSARAGLASGFGMGNGRCPAAIATDKSSEQYVLLCCGCYVRYCIVDAYTQGVCLFCSAVEQVFFSLRVANQQQCVGCVCLLVY